MDARLSKWLRWLKVIHGEIQQLVIAKNVFWSVQALIKKNKTLHKPSRFYQYLGDTYVSHTLMGIRRQVKIDNQSISLARLLKELANDASRISRHYYRHLYEGLVVASFADGDFDRFCDRAGDDLISPSMVSADLDELTNAAKICEAFADQRIAHRDKKDPKNLPKFHDIDKAIETLNRIYVKYHLMFHASQIDSLMPTYQYDWQEVFDHPWRLRNND